MVRERAGVRTFEVRWRAGDRRHRIVLGSERDGWSVEKANAALGAVARLKRPMSPELREALEAWVATIERGTDEGLPRFLMRRADG